METVSIIIATFGDRDKWNESAAWALRSVSEQTRPPDEVFKIHGKTLAAARNLAAQVASSDWLIFLDADDHIDAAYVYNMLYKNTDGDLRYPALSFDGGRTLKNYYIGKSLLEGNYLPIGTMVRRNLFLQVGGFEEYPMYEDWAMWLRCEHLGARSRYVPGAIYYANLHGGGRNRRTDSKLSLQIREDFITWRNCH